MFSDKIFLKKMIQKYNVQFVLMPKTSKPKKNLAIERIEEFERKIFNMKKEIRIVPQDLSDIGLTKVYDDGKFVVYRR